MGTKLAKLDTGTGIKLDVGAIEANILPHELSPESYNYGAGRKLYHPTKAETAGQAKIKTRGQATD